MFASPRPLPCPFVDALILNAVVIGGGTFGGVLGHVGGALRNGISALTRRETREMIPLSAM